MRCLAYAVGYGGYRYSYWRRTGTLHITGADTISYFCLLSSFLFFPLMFLSLVLQCLFVDASLSWPVLGEILRKAFLAESSISSQPEALFASFRFSATVFAQEHSSRPPPCDENSKIAWAQTRSSISCSVVRPQTRPSIFPLLPLSYSPGSTVDTCSYVSRRISVFSHGFLCPGLPGHEGAISPWTPRAYAVDDLGQWGCQTRRRTAETAHGLVFVRKR